MGVMRAIIRWVDNQMDKAYEETDERKAYSKAAVAGAIEGLCDGAVVMYPIVLVACHIWKKKANG